MLPILKSITLNLLKKICDPTFLTLEIFKKQKILKDTLSQILHYFDKISEISNCKMFDYSSVKINTVEWCKSWFFTKINVFIVYFCRFY